MKNIPKEIYLQVDDEMKESGDFGEKTTWCVDKINDEDIKYVRAGECILCTDEKELIACAECFTIAAQDDSQWISVKDRLPEEGAGYQLCIYRDHLSFVAFYNTSEKHWIDHEGYINVTHWMPLPDPPKENK